MLVTTVFQTVIPPRKHERQLINFLVPGDTMYLLAHSFTDHSLSRLKAYKAPQNLCSVLMDGGPDRPGVPQRPPSTQRASGCGPCGEGFALLSQVRKGGTYPHPQPLQLNPCHVQGSDQRSLL